jgi:hypothetical protein
VCTFKAQASVTLGIPPSDPCKQVIREYRKQERSDRHQGIKIPARHYNHLCQNSSGCKLTDHKHIFFVWKWVLKARYLYTSLLLTVCRAHCGTLSTALLPLPLDSPHFQTWFRPWELPQDLCFKNQNLRDLAPSNKSPSGSGLSTFQSLSTLFPCRWYNITTFLGKSQ